jgi:hypothetical protein
LIARVPQGFIITRYYHKHKQPIKIKWPTSTSILYRVRKQTKGIIAVRQVIVPVEVDNYTKQVENSACFIRVIIINRWGIALALLASFY